MRILWLNAGLLLPLDKGGKLRTWHLMRHLARRHEITYLSFAEPAQPTGTATGMREVVSRAGDDSAQRSGQRDAAFLRGRGAHLVDPLPYAVGKYRSAAYRRGLREPARRPAAST